MWWFARKEEPPPGLPALTYALLKRPDGWYFIRAYPDIGREWYREGPFPEKEDARYWAWKDAWDRGVVKKPESP